MLEKYMEVQVRAHAHTHLFIFNILHTKCKPRVGFLYKNLQVQILMAPSLTASLQYSQLP